MCWSPYIPYFKINIPIFYCSLFFEEYLNPPVRINKMVNQHTADYQISPSEVTSHPLIFLWTYKGYISAEYVLIFFPNLYIPWWLWKSFKFMVLKLLENTFASQKNGSVHFYSCPQAKLSPRFLSSPGRWKLSISPKKRFLKIYFFPSRKGGLWSWKNNQN